MGAEPAIARPAVRTPRSWRPIIANLSLAGAFVLIAQAGITGLTHTGVDGGVADDIRAGHRAFREANYEQALGYYHSALDAEPESALSAEMAACSSWRLGDGFRAVVYQQMAIWAGRDFQLFAKCYESPTPQLILGTLRIGSRSFLYRRPTPDDSKSRAALHRAREVGPSDRLHAAALLACVNHRAGLNRLAAFHLAYVRSTAPNEGMAASARRAFDECSA